MITGHVFMAMSLDGFIARRDHALDWLMKQDTVDEDHGYDAFMASVDGLVMGRGSFETVRGFDAWPYQKPVIVMSQSLSDSDIPQTLQSNVRVSRQDPDVLVQELSDAGWRRAYVDGGQIVQSFLRAGLIADLTVTQVPILIGDGVRLFGPLDHDIDLAHIETQTFPSGLVTSRYKVVDSPEDAVS